MEGAVAAVGLTKRDIVIHTNAQVSTRLQQFAFKHKPQTFSRVCLRLKQRVCHFKRCGLLWKRECYRSANAAAIVGVTVMFCHGKRHTLVMVLFLQTLTWTGTYSIDEVCNFP